MKISPKRVNGIEKATGKLGTSIVVVDVAFLSKNTTLQHHTWTSSAACPAATVLDFPSQGSDELIIRLGII